VATSELAQRATQAHRVAQTRIGAQASLRAVRLWRLVDLEDLSDSVPAWLDTMRVVVADGHRRSSALARRYFLQLRVLETGRALPGVLPEVTLETAAVDAGLAINGPGTTQRALRRGEQMARALQLGQVQSAREAARFVLDGGRRTISEAVAADREALGYSRVASGAACAFCAMLASRGPVYSEETVHFDTHKGCSCSAEPVWSTDTGWPEGSEHYRDVWDEATAGHSGRDAINAFRRALGNN
jgi:hypothetical protein